MHEDAAQPYVWVDLRPDEHAQLLLLVGNSGPTVATDVRAYVEGDIDVVGDARGPFGPIPTLRYAVDPADIRASLAVPPGTLNGVAWAVKDLGPATPGRCATTPARSSRHAHQRGRLIVAWATLMER